MRKQRMSLGHTRRMNQMRRIGVAAPLVWMSVAMPALARCTADLAFYNEARSAHGQINVECGRFHGAPFGNWGVDSSHGSRKDERQFRGGSTWIASVNGIHARVGTIPVNSSPVR